MKKTISMSDFPFFLEQLAAVNKKLEKLGIEKLSVLSQTRRIERIPNTFVDQEMLDLEITEPEFVAAGRDAAYVGTISFIEGVKGIYSTPFAQKKGYVLGAIANESLVCDACHTKRDRSCYHFFEEDGQLKSIGSSCAKDYFGWDISAAIDIVQPFFGFNSDEDEESAGSGYGAGSQAAGSSLRSLLAAADFVTDHFRKVWVSKTKAEIEGKASTAGAVLELFHLKPREIEEIYGKGATDRLKDLRDSYGTEAVFEAAKAKIVEKWSIAPATDFDYNIRANLFDDDTNTVRDWIYRPGIVLYAIHLALHVEALPEDSTPKSNEWVGEVDRRSTFTVTVVDMKSFDGIYGTTRLVIMHDEKGNTLKTFASGGFGYNVKVGEKLTIKATVKKHTTYHDEKQTMVTRASVVGEKKPKEKTL